MIELQSLTRFYGDHLALDGLTAKVEKGQICGFLGPNGAGKSTTMNILTGCLAATCGRALIDGFDVLEQPLEAKRRLGYLPEQPPLYGEMSPREYLLFVAQARGVARAGRKSAVDAAMERTGLTDVCRRQIRQLSKGYRQRVGLAQAITGDPPVLVLDEPTVGLDPNQIVEIRQLIKGLGGDHTVILSSHILSEVSAICDRVLILSKGRLVADDTPEHLSRAEKSAVIVLSARCAPEELQRTAQQMGCFDEITLTRDGELTNARLSVSGGDDPRAALSLQLGERRIPILTMELQQASLEDVFQTLTGREEQP